MVREAPLGRIAPSPTNCASADRSRDPACRRDNGLTVRAAEEQDMRFRTRFCWLSIAVGLCAVNAVAAPIDFTTGISTGVTLPQLNPSLPNETAGAIERPIPDYLVNKQYSAQIVTTGSAEKSESFLPLAGDRQNGFASALSDGQGALEVGVVNDRRGRGFFGAVSRYYTTIKNNTDEPIEFEFFFVVEPGEFGVLGTRASPGFGTANARVEASIEYLLRSPSGPFGGTYDETTDTLFEYFAGIEFNGDLVHSDNATVGELERSETALRYKTAKLASSVDLPIIPPFGELTIYYDMYASLSVLLFEVGGYARLGDPTDLIGGDSVRFVQRSGEPGPGPDPDPGQDPSPIPQPATVLLLCSGLVALIFVRRATGRTTRIA